MGSETETQGAAASRTAARAAFAFEASLQPRTTSKPCDASFLAATRPMPVFAPVMRTVFLSFLFLLPPASACALTTTEGDACLREGVVFFVVVEVF